MDSLFEEDMAGGKAPLPPKAGRRLSIEEAIKKDPIRDNEILEVKGQNYKVVPTAQGWRVYIGEGKYKGDQRPARPYADKAKILAEFMGYKRPTVERMEQLIERADAKYKNHYLTPSRAPRIAIGSLEKIADTESKDVAVTRDDDGYGY